MSWTAVGDTLKLSELLSLHLESGICKLHVKVASVTSYLAFRESRPSLSVSSQHMPSSWGLRVIHSAGTGPPPAIPGSQSQMLSYWLGLLVLEHCRAKEPAQVKGNF